MLNERIKGWTFFHILPQLQINKDTIWTDPFSQVFLDLGQVRIGTSREGILPCRLKLLKTGYTPTVKFISALAIVKKKNQCTKFFFSFFRGRQNLIQ